MDSNEAELIARARQGDRIALEALIAAVKDLVYNLALRMLGSRADAEDATQEILIRVVTNLDGFRGESAFRTWVFRVASSQLLKTRQRAGEQRFKSFEDMGEYLEAGVAEARAPLEDQLLVREAKLICTSMMVLRLDRDHRLAFILGEIFDLSSEEAAAVLEISPDAFRKRLSRARTRMAEFVTATCGLIDERRPCRCAKQAACAANRGHLSPATVTLANHPVRSQRDEREGYLEDLDGVARALSLFRSHPDYAGPDSVVEGLKALLVPKPGGLLA